MLVEKGDDRMMDKVILTSVSTKVEANNMKREIEHHLGIDCWIERSFWDRVFGKYKIVSDNHWGGKND